MNEDPIKNKKIRMAKMENDKNHKIVQSMIIDDKRKKIRKQKIAIDDYSCL